MGPDPDTKANTWITKLLLEAREQRHRYLRHFRSCAPKAGACAMTHRLIQKKLFEVHTKYWEMEKDYKGELHPWAAEKCKLIGLMAECVIAAESSGWGADEIFESAKSVVQQTHPKLRRKALREPGAETA